MDSKVIALAIVGVLIGAGVGIGAGYAVWNSDDAEGETYYFYLHFDTDNERNGWYEGNGSDALDGFDKAMKKAGFVWTRSSLGYVGKIDNAGSWAHYQYLYEATDALAADSSVLGVNEGEFFEYSNGWKSMTGYDWADANDKTMKLKQFNSNIYFLSVYVQTGPSTWEAKNPTTTDAWKNSGPFAAA